MPLHHYLPATYLALFSTDAITQPRRDRRLAAYDKKNHKSFFSSASKLAGINDLYTLTGSDIDNQIVDMCLSGYESCFYIAINQLINHEINALTWASTLVPFVTGLLVRGPDFNTRFVRRLSFIGNDTPIDNTNIGRLMEFQRLLAPVAVSSWLVLRILGDDPLITNDLGYAPFINLRTNESGMAIPIGFEYVLVIIPMFRRVLAIENGGEWIPMIRYEHEPPDNHKNLNKILAIHSRRFFFGSSESTIKQYVPNKSQPKYPLEPMQLGFVNGNVARNHEHS
jgi:hypothetical protein